jgi:hypothetical protein
VAAWKPERLCLTHFGHATDVGAQLERLRDSLRTGAASAQRGDRGRFLAEQDAGIDAAADPETAERLRQAAPAEYNWVGLERYWQKRAEAEAAAAEEH